MNWTQLFTNQQKLDQHIEDNHPRTEGENRLLKKVVAFQVELGELANEWRGFKFWSNDQEPKTIERKKCPKCNGNGMVGIAPGVRGVKKCDWCDNPRGGVKTTNPLLEEYIDIVHFTASLGLELNIKDFTLKHYEKGDKNVLELIHDLFFASSLVGYSEENFKMYNVLINHVTQLGIELGFSEDEIMKAYEQKNATNFHRQESGY